jgi:hypothetical protein
MTSTGYGANGLPADDPGPELGRPPLVDDGLNPGWREDQGPAGLAHEDEEPDGHELPDWPDDDEHDSVDVSWRDTDAPQPPTGSWAIRGDDQPEVDDPLYVFDDDGEVIDDDDEGPLGVDGFSIVGPYS